MKVASLEIDLLANIARLQKDMSRATGVVESAMSRIEQNVQRVQRVLGALGLGVGFGALIHQSRQLADAWQDLQNRLRLVTTSQEQLARATADVYRIAQQTSSGLDSVAQIYQRFSQNSDRLGLSMERVADLTEVVSKAVAVSGASAAAADAALMQFGQALAAGALRGEELNSVLEQTPALAQAIAHGLGVPLGALRELASQGRITADALVEALTRASEMVDSQFDTRVRTIAQAWVEVSNAITRYVGELSQTTGTASAVSGALSLLADNLATVMNVIGALTAVKLAQWFGDVAARMYEKVATSRAAVVATLEAANADAAATAQSLALANARLAEVRASTLAADGAVKIALTTNGLIPAQQRASAAALAHAQALTTQAAAAKAASVSSGLMSGAMAVLGGPVGLATTALIAGYAAWQSYSANTDKARGALVDVMNPLDLTREKIEMLTAAQARQQLMNIGEPYKQAQEEAMKFAAQVEWLQMQLRMHPSSKEAENWNRALIQAQGEFDTASQKVATYQSRIAELEAQLRMLQGLSAQADITKAMDGVVESFLADVQKRIKAMEGSQSAVARANQVIFENTNLTDGQRSAILLAAQAEDQYRKMLEDSAKARSNATKGLTAAANAYATLSASIHGRIEQLALEIATGDKASEADKLRIKVIQDLTAGKLKLTTAQKQQVDMLLKALKASESELNISKMVAAAKKQEIDLTAEAVKAAYDEARSNEQAAATYGMTASEVQRLTLARLEEKLAQAESLKLTAEEVKALELLIAAKQKNIAALGNIESREKQKAAWDDWARDVEQIFNRVGQSLTDAIFEGGKSGRDLLRDIFKSLTFNVLINPVMNQMQGWVTNQLGGMFGYQNPQQQQQQMMAQQQSGGLNFGTGFNATGIGEAITDVGGRLGSETLQNFGMGMSGKFATVAPGMEVATVDLISGTTTGGLTGANSAAGQAGNWLGANAGSILGYGAALYALTEKQYATAIGTAIGTYILPGIGTMVGGMIGGMVDGLIGGDPDVRFGGSYVYDRRTGRAAHDGGWQSGNPGDEFGNPVNALVESTAAAINAAFAGVGSQVYVDRLFGELESSEKGRGGVASGGWLVNLPGGMSAADVAAFNAVAPVRHHAPDEGGVRFGTANRGQGHGSRTGSLEEMYANLQTDLVQGVIQAWQHGINEFPVIVQDMIRGIDADSLSLEKASAVVQQVQAVIGQVQAFQAAVEQLPFENLKGLAFDAAASLLQLAGGIDGLLAAEQAYIQNFYSEAERTQMTWDAIGRVLGGVNMAVPETRDQFRAVKESLDLNSESGRQAYAALMSVQDAFASVTLSAEDLAAAAERAAEEQRRAAEEQQRAEEQAQQALWNAAVAAGESAYSALTRAVAAEKARMQRDAEAIATALRTSISAASTTVNELTGLTGRLTSTVQRMAGQLDEGRSRAWAQDRIDRALSVAKLTGVMPQGADFEQALQLVAQPSEGLFQSFEDYQADFLKTAHTVSELNELAEGQLSTERRALKAMEDQLAGSQQWYQSEIERLDAMLEAQRTALDIAMGTYQGVLSIPDAIAGVTSAITNLAILAPATSGTSATGGGTSGVGDYYAQKLAQLQVTGSKHDGVDWSKATTADLEAYFAGIGLTPLEHWEQWGRYEGLKRPSFDVGTAYVARDMTADVHRGEIIIDPRSSDILRRYGIGVQGGVGGSDAETKALLRQIVQRLDRLDEIERHTYDAALTNRQMTEQPQPVTVTNVVPTVAVTPGS